MGSLFSSQGWTHIPCMGRWTLNNWTTKEVSWTALTFLWICYQIWLVICLLCNLKDYYQTQYMSLAECHPQTSPGGSISDLTLSMINCAIYLIIDSAVLTMVSTSISHWLLLSVDQFLHVFIDFLVLTILLSSISCIFWKIREYGYKRIGTWIYEYGNIHRSPGQISLYFIIWNWPLFQFGLCVCVNYGLFF